MNKTQNPLEIREGFVFYNILVYWDMKTKYVNIDSKNLRYPLNENISLTAVSKIAFSDLSLNNSSITIHLVAFIANKSNKISLTEKQSDIDLITNSKNRTFDYLYFECEQIDEGLNASFTIELHSRY